MHVHTIVLVRVPWEKIIMLPRRRSKVRRASAEKFEKIKIVAMVKKNCHVFFCYLLFFRMIHRTEKN